MLKRVTANGVRVYLIDYLSPEDTATLMALYARFPESVEVQLEQVLSAQRAAFREAIRAEVSGGDVGASEGAVDLAVDAAMGVWADNHATVRARRLHEKWVQNYGHASIKDNGRTALFVEGAGMVVAKAVQDTPLYSGQEMSSRAVDCGVQPYVDPLGTAESRAVLERWRAFYNRAMPLVVDHVGATHPHRPGEDPKEYAQAVKMRAFDVCRAFVPFGCATNVGWTGTLRHVGDRLGVLVHHPDARVREVAGALLDLCRERYPHSGFGEPAVSGVGLLNEREEARAARKAWTARAAAELTYPAETAGLWHSADEVGNGVRFYGGLDGVGLEEHAALLADRPRGALVPHDLTCLGQVHYDFLLDGGSWRDVQRQRAITCRAALLTAAHGFEGWYLHQLPDGLRREAVLLVEEQARAVEALTDDPVVRQYYLGMGFRMRVRIRGCLPGMLYALELRSGKTIHPTLRRRVLEMARLFRAEYPKVALHVDEDLDDWTVRRGAHVVTARELPCFLGCGRSIPCPDGVQRMHGDCADPDSKTYVGIGG